MKFGVSVVIALGMATVAIGCHGCHTPSVPPVSAQAVVVYQELLAGGYMEADEGGSTAVQELFDSDVCPPWLACMMDGGAPTPCGVDALQLRGPH